MDQQKPTEWEKSVDAISPKQLLEDLLEILEREPIAQPSRNDMCVCGSNKKYKNCCLKKKELSSHPTTLRMESCKISYAQLTQEESQNEYNPPSEKDAKLLETLFHTTQKHPEDIDSEDCEFFQQLRVLRAKYPDNPAILTYILNGYEILGIYDRLDTLIDKMYEQFPNYLFAKTALANKYLRDGFPEKAVELFNGAYTLTGLYPKRTVFHVTEMRAFAYFMVRYFCTTERLKQAEIYLQILKDLLDEEDPLLQKIQEIFSKAKGLWNFKVACGQLGKLKS